MGGFPPVGATAKFNIAAVSACPPGPGLQAACRRDVRVAGIAALIALRAAECAVWAG